MIKRMKKEFKLLIDERRDIFDEKTRRIFLHKLVAMKLKRNFNEYDVSNVELIEHSYKEIGINYNDNIENIDKTIKHYKELSDNGKDNMKSSWGKIFKVKKYVRKYLYSNGWCSRKDNYFTLNSDSLNRPWFSTYYPISLNYGSLGYMIAQTILRGFNNKSFKNIIEGIEKNKFNIIQMSIKIFEQKSECFVKKYGMVKETITIKNINSLLTLNENIADNGGLKIAHKDYMKISAFDDFTNEQLFFINFGRSEYDHKSRDYLEKRINTNEHISAEILTNVALSNYKPFSDAFNCSINSKMNLEDKCESWKNY
uniref:Phosphate-regulating neutral endopeptidase (inferred by orthology to a human protein) n=1 Tax=Strongyloides venezuelensis TaxID=75913 RepID=A0A0K0FQF4_STRVS